MSDFPLIRSLQKKNDKTPLPKGHLYEEIVVEVEGQEITVNIPQKEVENFALMCSGDGPMYKYTFNKIMREVRGIRG